MTECFILLRLRALEKYLNGAILHVNYLCSVDRRGVYN